MQIIYLHTGYMQVILHIVYFLHYRFFYKISIMYILHLTEYKHFFKTLSLKDLWHKT